MGQNLDILSFHEDECDGQELHPERCISRISSLRMSGDTLDISLGFLSSCGLSWVPKATLSGDTVYLMYSVKPESEETLCYCYQCTRQVIKGVTTPNPVIVFEDSVISFSEDRYRTYPVTFDIINGDTINMTNHYGLRQGLWATKRRNHFYIFDEKDPYKYGILIKYKNGRTKYLSQDQYIVEYYRNGQKKREKYFDDNQYKTQCWDKKGREIESSR
jgi:hypothetical protein